MFDRKLLLGGAFSAAFLIAGCASTPEQPRTVDAGWPDWYQVYDADEQYFYGFGEGHSSRLNMATQQARLAAQTELAQAVDARVQALAQEGAQQSLDDPQVRGVFESAQRSLVDTSLSDAQPDQVHRVRQDDGSVRVFIRMRMPRNEADRIGRSVIDEMDRQLGAR
ncbi:hypothetical protein CAI21_04575 [Alkalilimnicola ehrlichii]|uniref:LPP20 lipoprotein n=1 Tax=Alkalilimnicola ehrlichii TaxID=351052 RepID=A0A3E0X2F2_9GAMM|nr:LPP20 family lipoprotein [Alkalilimnicola ehrlichii]RFA30785.1 hypothetical protein CAI21_04575 [Alkalilimnicola ehrlichii]RFA38363.1 hypothetical protein CAL65_05945 [Alkalilimnicola ehrlichii]